MGAGRRAQHHVERMQCHVARRFQAWHGRARLRQYRLGLPQRRLVHQPLAIQQRRDVQRRRLGVDLPACQIAPRLQALDGQVQVGRLCRHGQARCRPSRCRRLVVGARRFAFAAQAAEQVEFPRRFQVDFVRAAGARKPRRGIEHLAQRRLHRLIGACGLAIEIGGRQQGGVGRAQRCARLPHPGRRLRQVEVLRQCQRHQAGQVRIAKRRPPLLQFGCIGVLAQADCRLVQILRRLRQCGPLVIGTGGAAGGQAGGKQQEGEAQKGRDGHGDRPVRQKGNICDYNTFWSLIVHFGVAR